MRTEHLFDMKTSMNHNISETTGNRTLRTIRRVETVERIIWSAWLVLVGAALAVGAMALGFIKP